MVESRTLFLARRQWEEDQETIFCAIYRPTFDITVKNKRTSEINGTVTG